MNDIIVKNALSYDLGSDMHEAWRFPRKREDGTYEPRIKKTNDEYWQQVHGTNVVDIANCSFDELPSDWQFENLEAAKVAVDLVYDKVMSGETFTADETEQMAAIIHEEWLKRNDWVFSPDYGNPELAVAYVNLSKEEQEKDKAQLIPAQAKVKAYILGMVDVYTICEKYNLSTSGKGLK